MATPSTKESWSALCALLDGRSLLGGLHGTKLLGEKPTKFEDFFVWNASEPTAANHSTPTYVRLLEVSYTISQSMIGIPSYSKRSRKP